MQKPNNFTATQSHIAPPVSPKHHTPRPPVTPSDTHTPRHMPITVTAPQISQPVGAPPGHQLPIPLAVAPLQQTFSEYVAPLPATSAEHAVVEENAYAAPDVARRIRITRYRFRLPKSNHVTADVQSIITTDKDLERKPAAHYDFESVPNPDADGPSFWDEEVKSRVLDIDSSGALPEDTSAQVGEIQTQRNERPTLSSALSSMKRNYIIGKRSGKTIRDPMGNLIVEQDDIVTEVALAHAERTGKLVELIVALKLYQ